jgi:UDP-N-acetylmuramoyl-L-alanyl-D-glutamate--2,6-diaminopimelate ligase
VSSHALLQYRVHGLKFDSVAFTNLTQDHLDYHGSMENYYEAKRSLFELHAKGGMIVNGDDQYGSLLAQEYAVTTVGKTESARLRIEAVELDQSGSRFRFDGTQFQTPLIGRHNVENSAMAIAIVQQTAGISLDQCVESLAKARPVPGRLEAIEENQPFGVYVDYAHTDDALSNVLEALREITPGKLQVVFGCGGNRDAGKREKMGRVAIELADVVTVTTDNPRNEDPSIIARQIAEGCSSVRQEGWRIELDRARAIDEVLRSAQPGDTVLVAGKGHESYQEVNESVIPFDDREQTRTILANLGFER